jgi:hypothetical protein
MVGVLLQFALKTAIESLSPLSRPLLAVPAYIAFNLVLAVGSNVVVATTTLWLNARLDPWVPWHPVAAKRLAVQGLLTMLISFVVVSTIAGILIGFVVPYPDKTVAMERAMAVGTIIAFTLSTLYTGVHFFNQWGRSLAEVERLKREHLQSQFSTLKQQVNPHFLFNSLSTLTSLLVEDQQRAVEFVQKLAHVYRYVLEATDRDTVDLGTELHAAQAYAFLQQTRFGENLQIRVHVPEEYAHLRVAPLTLQMLLENAIKHNVISGERPLVVDVTVDGDHWLVVKNNVQKKISVEAGTRVGLRNIVNRYRFLGEGSVEIRETDREFIVRVPLLTQGQS